MKLTLVLLAVLLLVPLATPSFADSESMAATSQVVSEEGGGSSGPSTPIAS